jgi:hypothetical protein
MPRRSLIESISDEEREFIEAGRPQSTTQSIVREEAPAVREEISPPKDEEPAAPKKPAAPRKTPSVATLPPVLISQTYRLPAELVKELTKTAVARKLERTPPWSQQDIVAEALKQWLDKHASKQASM